MALAWVTSRWKTWVSSAQNFTTNPVTAKGETWQRRFEERIFRSRLAATARRSRGASPFTFRLGPTVEAGELPYPAASGNQGPLPLPGWLVPVLVPVSIARAQVIDDLLRFGVRILTPATRGLLVHYRGWLAEVGSESRAEAEISS
ncbi:DUF4166 domain-containing protein [Stagnihabitans tardus]|uniref:DUF4166 domain-containing protein n=1 Tax=Stagnihabitans tardus TaxID=2699202 RepID=A0AAE4YB92_9RHOB|nr:DUF4166 domain-containing protein [Stagnihabitans tardus]